MIIKFEEIGNIHQFENQFKFIGGVAMAKRKKGKTSTTTYLWKNSQIVINLNTVCHWVTF